MTTYIYIILKSNSMLNVFYSRFGTSTEPAIAVAPSTTLLDWPHGIVAEEASELYQGFWRIQRRMRRTGSLARFRVARQVGITLILQAGD